MAGALSVAVSVRLIWVWVKAACCPVRRECLLAAWIPTVGVAIF